MAISLESLKAHLNVTTDADDALLTDKLAAASEWVASYTGAPISDDTPAPVNEAIRQIAAHLYENREASLIGVTAEILPFGALTLLGPFRAWSF